MSISQQLFGVPLFIVFALIPSVVYMTNSFHLQTRTQGRHELHRGGMSDIFPVCAGH